jgi:hypothetical protein
MMPMPCPIGPKELIPMRVDTRTFTGCIITIVGAAALIGQQPASTDLTGTWIATRDAPASLPAAPSAVFGERFSLGVADRELTLTRPLRGASFVTRHSLDGAEVRSLVPGRTCMGDGTTVASVARTPDGLAYTLVSNIPAGGSATAVGLKYSFRLQSPDALVVETTMRDAAQAAPRAVGTVYRRSTDPMPPPIKAPEVSSAPATIAQVAWIAGEWEGTLGTSMVEERWTPAAGGAMLAISRTTRNGTTMSAFEFLCIAERGGSLVYTAMPNAGAPTDFVLTAIAADSASFENPANEFPKKIVYAKRPDGGLDATISGAEGRKPTTFSFKRRGGI